MYKPQVIIEKPMWQRRQRRLAPGPRAFSPLPLIPIFVPQKHRLRGVLALTGRRVGVTGAGQGHPGPVFLRTAGGSQAEDKSFCALLTSRALSQWGPVCDGERGCGPHLPSKNQCCPGAQGIQRPSPVSALCLPQASPRDCQKRPERVWPQARWVGGGASRRGAARGHIASQR